MTFHGCAAGRWRLLRVGDDYVLRLAEDHFIIVSDDKSLPLVTFRLNEEKMKEKKRTYTECALSTLRIAVDAYVAIPSARP